jgi:hypothetical protein
MKKILLYLLIIATITSCESIKRFDSRRLSPKYLFGKKTYLDSRIDFVSSAPAINIKNFLEGDLEGHGIKTNKHGEIAEVQLIKIKSRWQGNKAQIEFNYQLDGQTLDSRIWLLTLNQDGTFEANSHDAIGMVKGKQKGNTAQVIYDLMVPEFDRKVKSHFEDKFYLVDNSSAILVSKIGKYYQHDSTWTYSIKKVATEQVKKPEASTKPQQNPTNYQQLLMQQTKPRYQKIEFENQQQNPTDPNYSVENFNQQQYQPNVMPQNPYRGQYPSQQQLGQQSNGGYKNNKPEMSRSINNPYDIPREGQYGADYSTNPIAQEEMDPVSATNNANFNKNNQTKITQGNFSNPYITPPKFMKFAPKKRILVTPN